MFFKVILIICLFLCLSGMRIILKDGNYIDVNNYYFHRGKIILEINNKFYEISERFVDKENTMKFNYLELKKIGILTNYTALSLQNINKSNYLLKAPKTNIKKDDGKDTKIQLETRKEKSTFFMDQSDRDENFIEKLQRKGIMIKIRLPVEEDKK